MLRVEIWRVSVPLSEPVEAPGGRRERYEHVVTTVSDNQIQGWGASAETAEDLCDAIATRAAELLSARDLSIENLTSVEQFEQNTSPSAADLVGHAAANAISLATWDFLGRRLGIPCANFWGAQHTHVSCYASGLFLGRSTDALLAEARSYIGKGFNYVKMRAGLSPEQDVERFNLIADLFPEPGRVAVDAWRRGSVEDTIHFVGGIARDPLWLEDPVKYDEFDRLPELSLPLAAGECLLTAEELRNLLTSTPATHLLLDVKYLGGPLRFISAARELEALGARVGSHVHTVQSVHLLACVDDPLPVEVFDWSDALVTAPPSPGRDGRIKVAGPGFGVDLNSTVLSTYGRPVWSAERNTI